MTALSLSRPSRAALVQERQAIDVEIGALRQAFEREHAAALAAEAKATAEVIRLRRATFTIADTFRDQRLSLEARRAALDHQLGTSAPPAIAAGLARLDDLRRQILDSRDGSGRALNEAITSARDQVRAVALTAPNDQAAATAVEAALAPLRALASELL